jgi:uncharacterized Ntn-hydrolase superfamily protein
LSRSRSIAVVVALALLTAVPAPRAFAANMQGSLSIVALDPSTGEIGIAVLSDAPAVGAEVPWVDATVGAIATQGDVNPGWGPRGLEFLRRGIPPQAVCDSLYRNDPGYLRRQVGVVAMNGVSGGFTGLELIGFSAGVIDSFLAIQGNSLSYTDALFAARDSMLANAAMPLPERLLHVLTWGATRTRGPLRSAALVVGRVDPERPEYSTRWISLRVDDHRAPMGELLRMYRLHTATRLVESHLHFAEQAKAAGSSAREKAERARAQALMGGVLADTTMSATALNAMAWGIGKHLVHFDQAMKAVDRGLAREPKNRALLDTASHLAQLRGDRKTALRYAKEAAAVAPKDEYLAERVKALEADVAGK